MVSPFGGCSGSLDLQTKKVEKDGKKLEVVKKPCPVDVAIANTVNDS